VCIVSVANRDLARGVTLPVPDTGSVFANHSLDIIISVVPS